MNELITLFVGPGPIYDKPMDMTFRIWVPALQQTFVIQLDPNGAWRYI